MNGFLKILLVLSLTILLAACNGGGGSSKSGAVASDTFTNEPPIARAGSDMIVTEQELVSLDASASEDPDDVEISYRWEQTGGQSVVLSSSVDSNPSFIAPSGASILTFQLTVHDEEGLSDSDELSILVEPSNNEVPIADAGQDRLINISSLISLNGSLSTDADGDNLVYFWTQVAGTPVSLNAASTDRPSFVTPSFSDTLIFSLVVSDGKSLSEPDEVRIEIIAPPSNQAPIANAGADFETESGESITLNGLQSFDPDGDNLSYQWQQVGGENVPLSYSLSATPYFRPHSNPGVYSFSLTVSDGKLSSLADVVVVTVVEPDPVEPEPNNEPVADAGEGGEVSIGQVVSLDGSGSLDLDSDPITYIWNQVSGYDVVLSDYNVVNPQFVAPQAEGVVTFELIVSDGAANSTPDLVSFIVVNPDQSPTANAGGDLSVGISENVTLDGSQSFDPEGNSLSFQWSQISGTQVDMIGENTSSPSFVSPVESGTLVFGLVVFDGQLYSLEDRVTIIIDNPNVSPVANAGDDQSVIGNQSVVLSGVLSSDANGDDLGYNWSQLDGAEVQLNDATLSTPSFVAPNIDAVLTFALVVDDGVLTSAQDTVTISVTKTNAVPVANAGADLNALGNQLVLLDGSNSFDDDGDPLTFEWRFISGPVDVDISDSSLQNPSITVPFEGGEFIFGLTVSDGVAASNEDTVKIVAEALNRAPIAIAGEDQLLTGGSTVILDGSSSYDEDGDGLTFQWTQLSGPVVELNNSALSNPSFIAPEEGGVIEFSLAVNDGQYYSPGDTVVITVDKLNNAPVANAGENQEVSDNILVFVDGSLSSDPNGDALSYLWEAPSGSGIVINEPTNVMTSFISPASAGVYELSLTVSDGTLSSEPSVVSITVTPENAIPIAHAGEDLSVLGNSVVSLTAALSSDDDGDDLSYQWVQTVGSAVQLSSATSSSPTFTAPNLDATYEFELIVNDGQDDSLADSVVVDVTSVNLAPIADAGLDQTIDGGLVVTLDGSHSSDPESSDLSFSWVQVSGDQAITLSSSSDVAPTFTAPQLGGAYVFALTVNDGELDSVPSEVSININEINLPPIADAGPDLTLQGEQLVTLSGQASSDPNNDTLTYEWVQTGGPMVSLSSYTDMEPTFDVTNDDQIFQFSLEVSDGEYTSQADEIIVTITATDGIAIANAGPDQSVEGGVVVTLDGSLSSDPEGQALNYQWEQTFGATVALSNASSVDPQFTAPEEGGVFTFSLVVNDGIQDSLPAYVSIDVAPLNIPPIANAGVDRFVSLGSVVTLVGNKSYDPNGDPLTYIWTQQSGPTVELSSNTASALRFTAAEEGVLVFSLVANDGTFDSNVDLIEVTVGIIPVTNTKMNDTGITWGAAYPYGNNATCTGESIEQQDCYLGRDLTHNDDSDGKAGFSYVKISDEGVEIDSQESSWNCVRDQVTGLTWEVKQGGNGLVGDEGLHDADDLYNWFNPDMSENGGTIGFDNDDGAICHGYDADSSATYCNSTAFLDRVNEEGYCGYSDWRIPSRKELLTLVNYGSEGAKIDLDYFPNGGLFVWSSTPFTIGINNAWGVSFSGANSFSLGKSNRQRVRLVRSAP